MISINRIKPKHLELVVKIAETDQLQRAAEAVGVSQSAASRILHDLERDFGTELFVRHPTGMDPTPAGEVFVQHARGALTELTTLSSELEHLKSGKIGTVRVGAVTGPAVGHLMPAVHAFQSTFPEVRISVDVGPSSVLFRGLQETRYDFILGRADPRRNSKDYRFHPGRKENVLLLVHDSHPLAGLDVVDLKETSEYLWVIQEEGSPIRMAVENTFHAEGLPVPPMILNSSSLLVAFAQIEHGRAIAPQTEEVVRLFMSEKMGTKVRVLKTKSKFEVAPYFVIHDNRRTLSRAAAGLLKEVLGHF